ncbi:MAG: substrate-binding domain-containing protein [Lachnoclostridium sp.]|jgi:D-xylose transport system substrate-binding protein|nr:substrate-binding domain-containing protein [Lachnoclostridium sp.]
MNKYLSVYLTIIVLLSACNKPIIKVPERAEIEKAEIGFSMDSIVIERWQRDRDVFISNVKEYGMKVNFQNAHGNAEEQIRQIEYLIREEVSVLVVVARDADKLTDVINKAKNSGIKVIAYDRIIKNARMDLYISFDSEKVGILMADAMNQTLPPGSKVFLAMGSNVDENVAQVEKGIKKTLKKKLEIAETTYAENWEAERSAVYVSDYLKKNKNIHGIICGNDELAGEVIRVLSENRIAGKTIVVGQDADIAGCQRLVEGTQYMTVHKAFDPMAKEAALAAVSMVNGEMYTVDETYFNGTFQIPYKKYEPVAVTKSNLKKIIIDSGFHLEDDIFLIDKR